MSRDTVRHISTKRPYNGDVIDWILNHYDHVDVMLLKEAIRVLGIGRVTNDQWEEFWCKRGHKRLSDAVEHANRKGLTTVVSIKHEDVFQAMQQIKVIL